MSKLLKRGEAQRKRDDYMYMNNINDMVALDAELFWGIREAWVWGRK